MPQTTVSLSLEVRPNCVGRARTLLEAWRRGEEAGTEMYAELRARLPTVHFLSATVFSDAHYDPILAFEFNFDGDAEVFWRQLEAEYGGLLQDLVRCCKRPGDRSGTLFDRVIGSGAAPPVAAYLKARARRPIAMHQGNRGMDRPRIEQEAMLFAETGRILADAKAFAGATPVEIHARLRAALLPRFHWLGAHAPARITARERLMDLARLAGAQSLVIACLSLPGMLLSPFDARWLVFGFLVAGVGLLAAALSIGEAVSAKTLREARAELTLFLFHSLPWLASPLLLLAAFAALLAAYVACAATVIAIPILVATGMASEACWGQGARAALLGLASMAATVPSLLLWLRWVESRDPSQDEPPVTESQARLAEGEDQVAQNHMSSIVLIKPGVLRAVLIRVGLWNVGLLLRALATDGYLASMRTIHFAHWTFASNNSRLLFFSNFDGSWQSYIDDFIEKAHGGLSVAWGNCVGFPPTRFLALDGASHGRRFKAWARHSMAPALFWFSAYPYDTVNQIERHAAFANGLRRPTLTDQEAAAWIRTL